MSLTVGAQLEIFAGIRASIIAALQLSVSATSFSLTGVNMGINVIDIKLPAALDIEVTGAGIKVNGVELHI
jgi:hypothetical protein